MSKIINWIKFRYYIAQQNFYRIMKDSATSSDSKEYKRYQKKYDELMKNE